MNHFFGRVPSTGRKPQRAVGSAPPRFDWLVFRPDDDAAGYSASWIAWPFNKREQTRLLDRARMLELCEQLLPPYDTLGWKGAMFATTLYHLDRADYSDASEAGVAAIRRIDQRIAQTSRGGGGVWMQLTSDENAGLLLLTHEGVLSIVDDDENGPPADETSPQDDQNWLTAAYRPKRRILQLEADFPDRLLRARSTVELDWVLSMITDHGDLRAVKGR